MADRQQTAAGMGHRRNGHRGFQSRCNIYGGQNTKESSPWNFI